MIGFHDTSRCCAGGFAKLMARDVENGEAPTLLWERLKRPSLLGALVCLIVSLIFAAAGGAYVLKQPDVYQSFANMLIDQPRAIAGAGGEGVIIKLNSLRAKYAALLRTDSLTVPVAKKLGISKGQVVAAMNFFIPGPSLTLVVVARTHDPKKAQEIANAMGDELVVYIDAEQAAAKIPPADRIIFKVISRAPPGRLVEPTKNRALTVAAGIGGLSLVITYVIYQLIFGGRRLRL